MTTAEAKRPNKKRAKIEITGNESVEDLNSLDKGLNSRF